MRRPCCAAAACAAVLGAAWLVLGAFYLRSAALGHAALAIHSVAGGLAGSLHEPDPAPASLACNESFDPATGFGPDGPRLWLWWTTTTRA